MAQIKPKLVTHSLAPSLSLDPLSCCRICMCETTEELSNILDESGETDVSKRLTFCTGIQVTYKDGISTQICKLCLSNLQIAYSFKTTCIQSDTTLRNLPQQVIKTEPNDDFSDKDYENVFNDYLNVETKDEIKDEVLETVIEQQAGKVRKKYVSKKINEGSHKRKPKIKLKKKALWCDICSIQFKNKTEYFTHNRVHRPDKWVCEICGLVSTLREVHHSHMRGHRPSAYWCDHCDYKTSYKGDMVKHVGFHMPKRIKRFHCEYCSKSFATSSNMHCHIRYVHHGFKKFACVVCEHRFFDRTKLNRHMDSHNDIKRCEYCSKSFATSSNMHCHIRYVHHGFKKFACVVCEHRFFDRTKLNRHMDSHNDIKRCEYCSKSFATSSNMHCHIRYVHRGFKQFACVVCEHRFFNRTKLNRHMDSHNDIKRFECEVCLSMFTRRCYWKKHLLAKHGVSIPSMRPGRRKRYEEPPPRTPQEL